MTPDPAPQQHTGGGNKRGTRGGFGSIRKLPSGRWQARYTGPDQRQHPAPTTFETKGDAATWLALQHADITRRRWLPPEPKRGVTLAEYSEAWIKKAENRPVKPIRPRTAAHYRSLLERQILPALGRLDMTSLTPEIVEQWHISLDKTRPTLRAHAYALLHKLCKDAVPDYISANPCQTAGAGTAKRATVTTTATVQEIADIAAAMPERYRLLILLAAWTALRFGELTELRRKDVDVKRGLLHVRRAVVRVDGTTLISDPKSAAGTRDVHWPTHLSRDIQAHLANTPAGPDVLLFPAADGVSHLAPSTLYKAFYKARAAAGRPDLRFHDLRHTGGTLAAQTGATLKELMVRLGHSTPQAAMRYQHAAKGRDREIAAALSTMAEQAGSE